MAQNQSNTRETAQQSALGSMLEGRTELAETRLAVTAVQIVERLRLRAKNLKQLVEEELSIGTKLLQLKAGGFPAGYNKEIMGLEAKLEQQGSRNQGAQRREDVECWRDLANVMRDFLNAWENFSRNEARNRFLAALPQQTLPNIDSPGTVNPAPVCSTVHNDNITTTYIPQPR